MRSHFCKVKSYKSGDKIEFYRFGDFVMKTDFVPDLWDKLLPFLPNCDSAKYEYISFDDEELLDKALIFAVVRQFLKDKSLINNLLIVIKNLLPKDVEYWASEMRIFYYMYKGKKRPMRRLAKAFELVHLNL